MSTPSTHNPWHFIEKFPGECTTEVSRRGNAEPCDKPAYAVAFDPLAEIVNRRASS